MSSRTPSAASTSALPALLVTERLPCLATGTPAPAMTKAAVVEMLKVPLWSPPVPTMSVSGRGCGACTATALSRMARAQPAISATVSPFMRSATRNPPICACVASPGHDLHHRGVGLVLAQVVAVEQFGDGLLDHGAS